MDNQLNQEQLAVFLRKAKRSTYASSEASSRVTPLVTGSYQLEFRQGALLYRDIYFGGDFFAGLETVFHQGHPYWGMSYAGGINRGMDPDQVPGIYKFLKTALRAIPLEAPYRGPESLIEGRLSYKNRALGTPDRFSGVESISLDDSQIYNLHYSGGRLVG